MLEQELKNIFEKHIAEGNINRFKSAQEYVEFVFPEAYLTKEPDAWFIRTPGCNNYLGKHWSFEMAWVEAAKIIINLKNNGTFDSTMERCYKLSNC